VENCLFNMDWFVYFLIQYVSMINKKRCLFLLFIGITFVTFIGGEYWYYYRNGNFFGRKSDLESKQRRIHEKIPADVYEKLPVVTWNVS
jgi:hypothetical protein